jgi:hypothetical protein
MSADAICAAARRLIGLSWGEPATRREYSRLLAPWDPEPVAVQLARDQSSCALTVAAILLIAEVDGMVRGWRKRPVCDPLREPRAGHTDGVAYLEQLARQRSAYRRTGKDKPALYPGVWWTVGSGKGDEHVGLVVAVEGEIAVCVEGGQVDPLSPNHGSKACTRIALTRRQPAHVNGRWCLAGRPLLYTADAGELPTVGEGMPWSLIEVTP